MIYNKHFLLLASCTFNPIFTGKKWGDYGQKKIIYTHMEAIGAKKFEKTVILSFESSLVGRRRIGGGDGDDDDVSSCCGGLNRSAKVVGSVKT